MLDKRTAAVLGAINDACGEGSYKILAIGELIESVPARYRADEEGVRQIVDYLREREYVSVKYSDERELCVCPLPRGRQYFENEERDRKEGRKKFESYLLVAFLGAMIGALIGGAVVALITTFLLK